MVNNSRGVVVFFSTNYVNAFDAKHLVKFQNSLMSQNISLIFKLLFPLTVNMFLPRLNCPVPLWQDDQGYIHMSRLRVYLFRHINRNGHYIYTVLALLKYEAVENPYRHD